MKDENSGANSKLPKVDGGDFLAQLRAAGAFSGGDGNADAESTVGRSNRQNPRQDFASLENLFSQPDLQPPPASTKSDNNDVVMDRTSPPLEPPPPTTSPGKHRKGVSWGKNDYIQDDVSSLGAGHQRTVTMEDMMMRDGPFVEEAESNIIRALEQQRSVRDLRYATDNMLSQVPETVAHDFSYEDTKPSDGDIGEEDPERVERRPLVAASHRRTMTVEDTLAGLTDAMSALHKNDKGESYVNIIDKTPSSQAAEDPQSSGDVFAENAARLAAEERRRKARSMWDLVLLNLPSLKEEQAELEATQRAGSSTDSIEAFNQDDEEAQVGQANDVEKDGGNVNREKAGKKEGGNPKHARRGRRSTIINGATDRFKEDLEIWHSFFRPRKGTIATYVRSVLFYLVIPLLGVAACLFYLGDNPLQGVSEDGSSGDKPSISWWLIYIVRLAITFSLALAMQAIIIDFLALGTKIMIRVVGPVVTLLIVQAKGWPMICFWWGIFNLAMLSGDNAFARHWLFWQDAIGLFNAQNPSGHVVDSALNTTILTIVVCVSGVVALKRFAVGLYLGRQTFNNYGQDLAKIMNKMLLVSEVANLAKAIEKANSHREKAFDAYTVDSGIQLSRIANAAFSEDEEDNATNWDVSCESMALSENRDPLTDSIDSIEKERLMQILGQWEDPDTSYDRNNKEIATISSVLKFRKALALIQRTFPFSFSFGPAETREACVESAQKVYDRLLLRTPDKHVLPFETLALVAIAHGGLDQNKAKDLVRAFRPDREGRLTRLDFLKSVDSIYKTYRLLIAAIDNSSQIDRAFENIINVIFYTVVVIVVLSQLGYNPLALFLSLSSVILAFAFMIGSASSKYFEGVLFILVRRPYNIGDRIHVSNIEKDTSFDGAPGWTVEHVTLFETIARWLPTNEQCSLSNGSLAGSRIINWARSTEAQFHLFLKLPIDTPYERIVVLKNAIEQFMKARPREWLSFNGFRANRIETEKAYIEYVIVVKHRDSWQNIGQILDSKANMASYIREVTQQLGMDYKPPSLPVDMKYMQALPPSLEEQGSKEEVLDVDARMRDFKNITYKHNIRLG